MSYTHKNVPAYFAEHETDLVEPTVGVLYGPYRSLDHDEISELEREIFSRELTEYEKIVLEGWNQMAQRAVAYYEAGDENVTEQFESHAQRTFESLIKSVAI